MGLGGFVFSGDNVSFPEFDPCYAELSSGDRCYVVDGIDFVSVDIFIQGNRHGAFIQRCTNDDLVNEPGLKYIDFFRRQFLSACIVLFYRGDLDAERILTDLGNQIIADRDHVSFDQIDRAGV